MKRILFVLTAALIIASCSNDPPAVSRYMSRNETLCNDPWGKALTTSTDTVAAWLNKQKITFVDVHIEGEIFAGAAHYTNCDTLTNRVITVNVFFADTAKARAAGFTGR
ncbi:lipoprotein [Chitinophaga arvensicola]|uniref:Lipoprotein n=1 Tax=Chitinophaga arvensicola TaxID=29529 RepID=A0A1I0SFG1_9BACT|nr:lipoprotein [Chitinophaga arvensicola]SEW55995.1 hypothetical protein SAMN04488122_6533 [Chitinophaga arvensicola]